MRSGSNSVVATTTISSEGSPTWFAISRLASRAGGLEWKTRKPRPHRTRLPAKRAKFVVSSSEYTAAWKLADRCYGNALVAAVAAAMLSIHKQSGPAQIKIDAGGLGVTIGEACESNNHLSGRVSSPTSRCSYPDIISAAW